MIQNELQLSVTTEILRAFELTLKTEENAKILNQITIDAVKSTISDLNNQITEYQLKNL